MKEAPKRNEQELAEQAKSRLIDYRDMQQDIDFMVERLARMTAKLETPGTQWIKEPGTGESKLNDMPRAPGYSGDRLTDQIARKIELEEEIRQAESMERAEYEIIKLVTTHMERPDERAIIQLRYLDGAKWNEICETIYGNRKDFGEKNDYYMRQTFKKHGAAFLSFAKAWNEVGEKQ